MNKKTELTYFPTWTAGKDGYAQRVRELFQNYLRKKGLVYTFQRSKILNLFLHADRHLSEEDICKGLKREGVGKITVFRTLKLLKECSLIEQVTDSSGKSRYEIEIDRPHHDHLVCLECGAIMEIQWPEVEKIQEKVSKKIGFTIQYHRHELFGRCKECAKKKN